MVEFAFIMEPKFGWVIEITFNSYCVDFSLFDFWLNADRKATKETKIECWMVFPDPRNMYPMSFKRYACFKSTCIFSGVSISISAQRSFGEG